MKKDYSFETFDKRHIPKALDLIRKAYDEERAKVDCLPHIEALPSLNDFARNELGVAALYKNELVGFLCCLTPWDDFFGTSRGTFVPINAHATVREDRKMLYSLLYEKAASVWVRQGILSHAIGVYTQDTEAVESFFINGFGLRTIDAIRPLEPIGMAETDLRIKYHELDEDRFGEILPQLNNLIGHLNNSPMFMPHRKIDDNRFTDDVKKSKRRYFVAESNGRPIGHIKITEGGESFIGETGTMANIQGAYIYEEFRGMGVYSNLLEYTINKLKDEGYHQLGVDFESFNPTARGFWLKHFTPYIYGMTRRIDERIVKLYE